MAETADLTWIGCPLCPERFEAPSGDASKFKEARVEFEKHMAGKHDYVRREKWGWVPATAKCPECPRVVSRAGLKAHLASHQAEKLGVKTKR